MIAKVWELIDRLRQSDYNVGIDQYIMAERLLRTLESEGGLPEPARWEPLLAPVLCTTPGEQQDFHRHFIDWIDSDRSIVDRKANERLPGIKAHDQARSVQHWKSPWSLLAYGLIALIGFALWIGNPFPGPSTPAIWQELSTLIEGAWPIRMPPPRDYTTVDIIPQQIIQPSNEERVQRLPPREQFYYRYYGWIRIGVPALLLVAASAWLIWQRHRRLQLERGYTEARPQPQFIPASDEIAKLYFGNEFRDVLRVLRRSQETEVLDLNIDRTVIRSVQQGGALSLVYTSRKEAAEYLALVERASMADLGARYTDAILDYLSLNNIYLDRYYFQGDPRTCYGVGTGSTAITLRELSARFPRHHLLLFSDGRGLVDPLSACPYSWSGQLTAWTRRSILSPEQEVDWSYRYQILSEDGYSIAAATPHGLVGVVDPDEIDGRDLDYDPWEVGYPTLLKEQPERWMSIVGPEEDMRIALEVDLMYSLGEKGYHWLAACAVYPVMQWEVIVFLGKRLVGEEEFNSTFRKLLRLPWFRYGSIPDWLRSMLIVSLPPAVERTVRKEIAELLGGGVDGRGKLGLPVVDPSRLPAAPVRTGEGNDYLFLNFLTGRRPGPLALRVPERLKRFLIYEGNWKPSILPVFTLGLVVLCSVCFAVVAGNRPELPGQSVRAVPSVVAWPRQVVTGTIVDVKVVTDGADSFSLRGIRLAFADSTGNSNDTVTTYTSDTIAKARFYIPGDLVSDTITLTLRRDTGVIGSFGVQVIRDGIVISPDPLIGTITLVPEVVRQGETREFIARTSDCQSLGLYKSSVQTSPELGSRIAFRVTASDSCLLRGRIVVSKDAPVGTASINIINSAGKVLLTTSIRIDSTVVVLPFDRDILSREDITFIGALRSSIRTSEVALRKLLPASTVSPSEFKSLTDALTKQDARLQKRLLRNDSLRPAEQSDMRKEVDALDSRVDALAKVIASSTAIMFDCDCNRSASQEAIKSLRRELPTEQMLRDALCCFVADAEPPSMNEAIRMLEYLEIDRGSIETLKGIVRVTLPDNSQISIIPLARCYKIEYVDQKVYTEICKMKAGLESP